MDAAGRLRGDRGGRWVTAAAQSPPVAGVAVVVQCRLQRYHIPLLGSPCRASRHFPHWGQPELSASLRGSAVREALGLAPGAASARCGGGAAGLPLQTTAPTASAARVRPLLAPVSTGVFRPLALGADPAGTERSLPLVPQSAMPELACTYGPGCRRHPSASGLSAVCARRRDLLRVLSASLRVHEHCLEKLARLSL